MKYVLISALLATTACAQLTGDPVADCLAARNMVINATAGATLAASIAASNPQSVRMQQAAALAQTALTLAIAQQSRTCPVGE